jgi:hypothetical protein
MATEQQLIDALKKADAAGDSEGASILAAELLRVRGQEPPETLSDYAGSAVYGASPYATAALAGGAAGAPFAGIGAPIGAAGGVAALGLGDIATAGYNAFAPLFGGRTVPLPSQQISERLANIGFGKRPQTSGQRLLSATTGALTTAGVQPLALRNLAPVVTGPTTSRVVSELAKNPAMQAVAGGSAGFAGQAATEAGADPWLAALASLGGGAIGGKLMMPKQKVPTAQDIRDRASLAYTKAEQAGVKFRPQYIQQMAQDMTSKLLGDNFEYVPGLHPRIKVAIDEVEKVAADAAASGGVSLPRIEKLRRIINTASNSLDRDERRLGYMMRNTLDDFVVNAKPKVDIMAGYGKGNTGISALTEARKLYSQASKSDTIQQLIDRASLAEGNFATNLKGQFRRLANREASMRFFSKSEQDAIRGLAKGTMSDNTLGFLAAFAPSKDLRGLTSMFAQGAAFTAAGNPWLTAISMTGGAAASGARNLRAKTAAQNLAMQTRGVTPQKTPYSLIAPAVGQQSIVWPYKIPQGR